MIKFIKRIWCKLFYAQKLNQRNNTFSLICFEYDPIGDTWIEWI